MFLGIVGAHGAICIADALKINISLTCLDVSDNFFADDSVIGGGEAVQKLAEAIRDNTALTTLDLAFVQCSARGYRVLAEAFKVNRTLTSVDLSGNNMDFAAAEMFAAVLEANNALQSLSFAHSFYSDPRHSLFG